MKRLLILTAILLTLLLIAWETRAQNRKPIEFGYTLVVDGIYFRVDTVHNRTQVINYTGKKVFIYINDTIGRELPKNGRMTVWNSHFIITIVRKKIRREYSI